MTLSVREVRDTWEPKRTLWLVSDPEASGLAAVEHLPQPDRAGRHLMCSSCVSLDCEHVDAAVRFIGPAPEQARPFRASDFVD